MTQIPTIDNKESVACFGDNCGENKTKQLKKELLDAEIKAEMIAEARK